MKETPEEKLKRRREVVAWLRYCADEEEKVAADMRRRADELDPDRESVRDP